MSHDLSAALRVLRRLAPALCLTALPAMAAQPGPAGKPPRPAPFTIPDSFPGPLLKRCLDGPLRDVDEIVFAVRVPGRDHWYVTFGNYSDDSDYARRLGFRFEEGVWWGYGDGGRLCRLNLRTGELHTILDDPTGGVRDPQVHYDGNKILFSYRKGGSRTFHLHEINIDGSGLRQLTDGPDDDIEPAYCPDGSIVFGSSRCRRFVNCWYTRVATLHRCDADGRNVRMLSTNNDHDNTPWVLPDGRVLYMRWEYVDRSQLDFHHLWTMNPDGTNQTVFFGNMTGGTSMLDAKPIPGSGKVVASFSPGHGRPEHLGWVTVVDPKLGPDNPSAARRVSRSPDWKDPYAISEDCFLVAHARGIVVMDGQGNAELVHRLSDEDARTLQCHEPRVIRPRPREAVISPRVDLARATGRYLLQDIYHGRGMEGVERGAIKKLLVLQQLPKPVNFSGGMEPLTIGGSFTLAGIVGEVPVEPDGSAFMELPAMRSLFFVALDANGRSVKRMHSFTTLQPGEVTGCVGCHEHRTRAPLDQKASLLAMAKPAVPVTPVAGIPSVPDFPRDIQPILDQHCVACHNSERREGAVDLCGDRTPGYTIAYWTMQSHRLVADGRNLPIGNPQPYTYGSAASRLLELAAGGHYDVKANDRELLMLRMWLDTSATYPGTYAALGCGMHHVNPAPKGVMERCGSCHTATHKDRQGKQYSALTIRGRTGRALEVYQNIDHPERALLLRAPLAREAGGLGICPDAPLKGTEDPVYQSLLAALTDGHRRLLAGKRFDMEGFRPNPHYLREMQRWGILPANLPPAAPVDPYQTDRAYWDSFYYQPAAGMAAAP